LPKTPFGNNIFWINILIVRKKKTFNLIKKILIKKNFDIKNFWKPMHLQKFYKNLYFLDMKNTNYYWNKVITLPSSVDLKTSEQNEIISLVNNVS
jgi:dTDP-4-amino-4,6-dideoxygalactose transaminase